MKKLTLRLCALFAVFLFAFSSVSFADAVELDGNHYYTFYSLAESSTYTSFTDSFTADQINDPLYIKVNIQLSSPIEEMDTFDVNFTFYSSNFGSCRLEKIECLNASYGLLHSFDIGLDISNTINVLCGRNTYGSDISIISVILKFTGINSNTFRFSLTGFSNEPSTDNSYPLSFIDGLVGKLKDAFTGLFVPTESQMNVISDNWMNLAKSRFGAVYECTSIISDYAKSFQETSAETYIKFPIYNFDLGVCKWEIGGWYVKLVPDGFEPVVNSLKLIVNIVCTLALVNALRRRFENTIGGHKDDS